MARISLENVTIEFPVFTVGSRSLRRAFLGATGGRILKRDNHAPLTVVALEDISLSFTRGDRVALVGGNGCGKTTLLRVLAGIYEPVSGVVQVDGRVAPLFDIALGIESDATGYENIFIRAAHLGLSRAETLDRLEGITEFSQLGDYLNLPVRTYSAGMSLRLALAVSTCFEADILLLDEWIGAGDSFFLERAHQRMASFVERSSLLVMASHSPELVRSWCNKAVLLEHGRMVAVGDVDTILARHEESQHSQALA